MNRPMIRCILLFALLAPASVALAQTAPKKAPTPSDDQPAVSTSSGAIPSAPPPTSGPVRPQNSGTTIVGERESPIGLYITPWRNASAETDIDRPARLLSVSLDPLDRRVFARQVEYFEALTAAQKAKVTPAPSAPQAQP